MIEFNNRSSTIDFLLSRRSAPARTLGGEGPTGAELRQILQAAIRVPDHGKLAPWRFIVIEDRKAFADMAAEHYAYEAGRDANDIERQGFFNIINQAPTLIVAIFVPQEGRIPIFEQQLSTGAAIQNLKLAAGALGYESSWITGRIAHLDGITDRLGVPGGQIAGLLFLGHCDDTLAERQRPKITEVISFWPHKEQQKG